MMSKIMLIKGENNHSQQLDSTRVENTKNPSNKNIFLKTFC